MTTSEAHRSQRAKIPAGARGRKVHTLVIGAGQAGLATSYWLQRAGIEHLLVERRRAPGRRLARPLGQLHPGRAELHPAAARHAVLRTRIPRASCRATRWWATCRTTPPSSAHRCGWTPASIGCRPSQGHFEAHSGGDDLPGRERRARHRALPAAEDPAAPRAPCRAHIQQVHSNDYRRPAQLAGGGVLVVGTGQSGAQIAEELLHAGRERAPGRFDVPPRPPPLPRPRLHLVADAVVPPRRRGGRALSHRRRLCPRPPPASRCNPHVSGKDGGHDINLRQLARQGMHLYGQLESIDGATARFTDDLAERLRFADTKFDEEFRPLFDAYIAAAGIDAPRRRSPPTRRLHARRRSPSSTSTAPACAAWSGRPATGSTSAGWTCRCSTQWGYPKHVRGVTIHPGLYAVGLPWLYSEPSSVFAGVGADAAHIVDHIARHRSGSLWTLIGGSPYDDGSRRVNTFSTERRGTMANIVRRNEGESREAAPRRGYFDPMHRFDPFRMMGELLRWDPFSEFDRFGPGAGGAGFLPPVDVREMADAFLFRVDLPGVKEEDVDVSLTGNRLTISGQRQDEKRDEQDKLPFVRVLVRKLLAVVHAAGQYRCRQREGRDEERRSRRHHPEAARGEGPAHLPGAQAAG